MAGGRGEGPAQRAFYRATFTAQKSVTVLHAAFEAQEVAARKAGNVDAAEAWATHRVAVEEAIWAGNRALLDYVVDVQVIPYLVVHVFPWWLAVVVLPGLGCCGQWRRVD